MGVGRAPPGGSVLFNIATLLREAPGAARQIHVENEPASVESEGYERLVTGAVHLLRTSRGILFRAKVRVEPEYQCDRCLRTFTTPVDLDIDELFAFVRDPVTLRPVELDEDTFRLEDEQYLDASEAVRQYEEAARPIRTLCRPDCAGLCPRCGKDLNDGPCSCPAEDIEPAWSALAELSARLAAPEVPDGRS